MGLWLWILILKAEIIMCTHVDSSGYSRGALLIIYHVFGLRGCIPSPFGEAEGLAPPVAAASMVAR